MKKLLLSTSLFCATLISTQAQITITSADITTPNHIIYQATDTLPTVSVGSGGANQTWTMTTLGQQLHDTLTFLPVSWVPNANFPTATIVVQQGLSSNYAYMISTNDSLGFVGNHVNASFSGTAISFNQFVSPDEKLANFPFTYNSTFTNKYITHAKFAVGATIMGAMVDSARQYGTITKTVMTDGWGTITTPLGTYPALRTKETKVSHDSADAKINFGLSFWQNVQNTTTTTVSFVWWANGVGFPLVTANMDSAGTVLKSVQWLMQVPFVGINEYTDAINENVFPNPAQDQINFRGDASKQKSIQVFDIAGRLISSYSLINNTTSINTSSFANGLYTYSIIGKDNTVCSRGKFSITK